MLLSTLKSLLLGALLVAGAVGAAYIVTNRDMVSWSWPAVTATILAALTVFLLFLPANKGGQQLGPRNPWYFVEQGIADVQDAHPSARRGDIHWLLVAVPMIVAMFIAMLRSWGSI